MLANGWCDGLFDYCFVYGERRALIQVGNIGGEAAHYRVDGFSDKISIRFYDGRPGQPVDAKLVADTAALGNTWKSTSVNAGQCYVIVERLYDSALFEKGKPDFEFVMRGLREYDPWIRRLPGAPARSASTIHPRGFSLAIRLCIV